MRAEDAIFQQAVNRDLDILFMVDDSSSMTPLQNKLTANFPVFMHVLEGLPGGLPNVHVGVVSSSMGAGRNPSIDHCPQGGDAGLFHARPLGSTCGKASLDAGQTFISNINGLANYTGDLADVFGCIAALGDGGCGFEHPFASVLRALGADGRPAPAANGNFLRADATLAVILITNEDDCSAPPDSDLFDATSALVSDPLGPLQSYRCNEFGHLCGGVAPPRTPAGPTDLTGSCVSAEDGRLLRVADVVAALKKLKSDPNKVIVAAIAGPPAPYVVDVAPGQDGDPHPWPSIDHSCTTKEPDGSVTFGDPAIRVKQWVDAFGGNGVFETICDATFARSLEGIANTIAVDIEPPCITGTVLDTAGAPWIGTTRPDCSVIDHRTNAAGVIIDVPLPPCAPGENAGATACWHLDDLASVCAGGHVISFNRPGEPTRGDPTKGDPTTGQLDSVVSCAVRVTTPKGTSVAPAGCY
jgi:hypothetical protein